MKKTQISSLRVHLGLGQFPGAALKNLSDEIFQ